MILDVGQASPLELLRLEEMRLAEHVTNLGCAEVFTQQLLTPTLQPCHLVFVTYGQQGQCWRQLQLAVLATLGAARRLGHQLFGTWEAVGVEELQEGLEGGRVTVLDDDFLGD